MKKALLLCIVPLLAFAQHQREFSLATYNSLRYSPSNIDARHPYFRTIIQQMDADILVMQEMDGQSAANMFRDSVMNIDSNVYSLGTVIDGSGMDVVLYYKTSKFSALATRSYPTSLRDIFHFRLIPSGFADTLHVFGVHLKASSGSTNEGRRASEVAVLRGVTNQFADSTNFVVCGDFNIYGSTEPAYQALLDDSPADDGNFVDRINLSGTWNNSAYAQYHTQSPRTTQFNGGAHGGMDDRFDMILLSNALSSPAGLGYKSGSMLAFGNDGNHYNKAIIDMPNNNQYDLPMRTALHQASDHIPVMATFTYTASYLGLTESGSEESVRIGYSSEGPILQNPSGLHLDGALYSVNGQLISEFSTSTNHKLNLARGAYVLVATHRGKVVLREKVLN